MADLVWDAKKLGGKIGTGNKRVDYGNAFVNENIQRVKAKKKHKRKLSRSFTPTGRVGDVKIISLHTDKDGLVIVENETEYAAVVPPENLTVAVAIERKPSHCVFMPGEILAGWEALRSWVDGAPSPPPRASRTIASNSRPRWALPAASIRTSSCRRWTNGSGRAEPLPDGPPQIGDRHTCAVPEL